MKKKIKHTHTNGEKNEMRWIHIHQSCECQCMCLWEKRRQNERETEREGEKAHKCVIEGVLWWSLAICRFATKFSNHCFKLTWRVTSYIERCMYECVRDCILLFSHPFQFEILFCHIALFWHIVWQGVETETLTNNNSSNSNHDLQHVRPIRNTQIEYETLFDREVT